MIDLGVLVRQMARWRRALPMVRPFYAVKCNPSLPILQTLAACGAGFDCASKQEIELILSHHLVCDPEKDIIFANPCKQIGDLRAITINKYHVRFVTVDSVAEMIKLHRYFPQAKILIRIATNDVHAVCAFSTKFGASLDDVEKILEAAVKYKLEIYGVSFHVGSGNGDINAYAAALYDAAKVFRQAASFGFNCSLLDIGGGYPGDISFQDDHHFSCTNSKLTTPPNNNNNNSDNNDSNNTFESIASVIRPILETEFCDTIIIAEPGRFFTAASHTLVMNVFGERHIRLSTSSANEIKARLVQEQERQQETEHLHEANNSNIGDGNCEAVQHVPANWSNVDWTVEHQYYVNDGLYHSFNCVLYDHAHPKLHIVYDNSGNDQLNESDNNDRGGVSSKIDRPLQVTTIFGPTCDSLDCILKQSLFPALYSPSSFSSRYSISSTSVTSRYRHTCSDWVMCTDMGSYTTAAGCAFNGFATRRTEYVCSLDL